MQRRPQQAVLQDTLTEVRSRSKECLVLLEQVSEQGSPCMISDRLYHGWVQEKEASAGKQREIEHFQASVANLTKEVEACRHSVFMTMISASTCVGR